MEMLLLVERTANTAEESLHLESVSNSIVKECSVVMDSTFGSRPELLTGSYPELVECE
jgi:hypothetical protein